MEGREEKERNCEGGVDVVLDAGEETGEGVVGVGIGGVLELVGVVLVVLIADIVDA